MKALRMFILLFTIGLYWPHFSQGQSKELMVVLMQTPLNDSLWPATLYTNHMQLEGTNNDGETVKWRTTDFASYYEKLALLDMSVIVTISVIAPKRGENEGTLSYEFLQGEVKQVHSSGKYVKDIFNLESVPPLFYYARAVEADPKGPFSKCKTNKEGASCPFEYNSWPVADMKMVYDIPSSIGYKPTPTLACSALTLFPKNTLWEGKKYSRTEIRRELIDRAVAEKKREDRRRVIDFNRNHIVTFWCFDENDNYTFIPSIERNPWGLDSNWTMEQVVSALGPMIYVKHTVYEWEYTQKMDGLSIYFLFKDKGNTLYLQKMRITSCDYPDGMESAYTRENNQEAVLDYFEGILPKPKCIQGDCQNGIGMFQVSNSTYAGHFKSGQPEGEGVMFDGRFKAGIFRRGWLQSAQEVNINKVFLGDGMNGPYAVYNNGDIKIGHLYHGKLHGMAYTENEVYTEEVEYVHGEKRGFSTMYMKKTNKTIGSYYENDGNRLHLRDYFKKYVSCPNVEPEPYTPREGHDVSDVMSNVLYNSMREQCFNPGEGKLVTTGAGGVAKVFEFTPTKFTLYQFSVISKEMGAGSLYFKNMKGEELVSISIGVNDVMKGAVGYYYGIDGLEWNENDRIEVWWRGTANKEYRIRRYSHQLK